MPGTNAPASDGSSRCRAGLVALRPAGRSSDLRRVVREKPLPAGPNSGRTEQRHARHGTGTRARLTGRPEYRRPDLASVPFHDPHALTWCPVGSTFRLCHGFHSTPMDSTNRGTDPLHGLQRMRFVRRTAPVPVKAPVYLHVDF
jgi:hypothetical protein